MSVETQQHCLAVSAVAYICSTGECARRSSHLHLAQSSVQSTLQISMIWAIPSQPFTSELRHKALSMRASKGQCLVLNAQAACCCKCAECWCNIKHQLGCGRASTWNFTPGAAEVPCLLQQTSRLSMVIGTIHSKLSSKDEQCLSATHIV